MTSGVALDPVLQGSRLASGPLELALLAAVIVLWLLFGAWLWRASERMHRVALAVVYGCVVVALCAGVLAQEALLFYTGISIAGYATVATLLAVHGVDHARTAAAQAMLLVLGDLILFELLAYLYSEAQATGFGELRAAYREKGGGLSFVGGLLVATGGCRIAGLLLLAPLPGRLYPWRPGAVTGLLCVAMVAGLLLGVRLVDPSLAAPEVWYTLLGMLGAALVAHLLVVTCVLSLARRGGLLQGVSVLASRAAVFGAGMLARVGELTMRLAPRLRALEQRFLSWSVAVATATAFAVLVALSAVS
ncbi:MAG: hypothetical protein ABR578_02620 [Chromatocurvus sp.]